MRALDDYMTGAGWAFPKFLAMRLFPELIDELGGTAAASTARFEATHRDINALVAYTNHTAADRVLQVH